MDQMALTFFVDTHGDTDKSYEKNFYFYLKNSTGNAG